MNMEEYKKAMQEVHINTDVVKSRFEETKVKNINKSLCYKKSAFVLAMSVILVVIVPILNSFKTESIPDITLKVYASDLNKERVLSSIPVTLSTLHQPNLQAITNKGERNETGSINYNLSFQCVGENIKNITYKLSDKEITRENRGDVVAWFAENYSHSVRNFNYENEKSNYRIIQENDNLIVTKMIGSSYTVDYENQNNKQYLLEINLNSDDKGNLTAENFIINVIITMNNGKILEKQILVNPLEVEQSDNNIYQIEMRLKE